MDTFSEGKFSTIQTFGRGARYECNGLGDVEFRIGVPAWVRVLDGNLCLDVFTHLTGHGRPLLVLAQDAVVADRPVPWFYRSKWRQHFPEFNLITYNDPTLYEDRRLRAGYLAARGARQLVNGLVRRIMEKMGLDERNTVHYGASAGGYSVLANCSTFPRAAHVVDIPRVHFNQRRPNPNLELLLDCLGLPGIPPATEELRRHFSEPIEKLVYLQHVGDSRFMKGQLPEFLEFLKLAAQQGQDLVRDFQLVLYRNPFATRGHSPMPEADTVKLLRQLLVDRSR